MKQLPLLPASSLPCVVRYALLFENLPLWPGQSESGKGRPPFDRNLLLRALIYKCLRRIPTLTDLSFDLENNPAALSALGFDPLQPPPSVERFSCFLRETDNLPFQKIRKALVQELIQSGAVSGTVLALDSCPVTVLVKENNLKTSLRRKRFDKQAPPAGDPEAGLGVKIHFPGDPLKQVTYFWGYRNHILVDTASELPLAEFTRPANISDVTLALPLLKVAVELSLPVSHVTADSIYDVESILGFILNDLHAQPIVAHNSRSETGVVYTIRQGKVYCAADLPMAGRGKGKHKRTGYVYQQFGCPIHWRKAFARQFLLCPAGHPKFTEGKGCNVMLRLTPSARSHIPYGTQAFQDIYRKRTAVERSFSRLLVLTMEDPTVVGLKAVTNHCTISHLATLLVALTAVKHQAKDKMRWIKSFVPRFLKT